MLAEPLSVHIADPLDFSAFAPVSLAGIDDEAARLTRVDRKYIVAGDIADRLLVRLADNFRVLSINDRRHTSYRSIYFDTPDLVTCRAHIQQRRRRWKVRSRLYVEDELCRIEVKTRDGRGVNVKHLSDSSPARYGSLDGVEAAFVSGILAAHGADIDPAGLVPTMEVRYRRATLVNSVTATRVTFDWDIRCQLGSDRLWFDDTCVLIETKGDLRPGDADRELMHLGARPRPFSKYASSASLLRDELADNAVRRLHGRQIHSDRGREVA